MTDVMMPEISGRETAERLVALCPGLKVLCISGTTNDAVVRHGVLEAETAFLQEPFRPNDLAHKVGPVLGARPGNTLGWADNGRYSKTGQFDSSARSSGSGWAWRPSQQWTSP